jgi:hypothetical protein
MADKDLTQVRRMVRSHPAGLAPAERRLAALKLGQALRRSNLKRIAANTTRRHPLRPA